MRPIQRVGLVLGPIIFVVMLLFPAPGELPDVGWRTAAVAALMAIWWMTEAIPLPATALLPLALFPVLGVLSMADAAGPFANDLIFLFMGGFMIAVAMERWGLHKRIALSIMSAVGTSPERLVLGFMLATAFLSMWISNTATAVMMLPMAIAVGELFRPQDTEGPYEFGICLMLGIAYAASIGGLSTLVGTPPNAVLAGAALELLDFEIGFGQWMLVGVPVTLFMLPVAWFALTRVLYPPGKLAGDAAAILAAEKSQLGEMDAGERVVAVVFSLTCLSWVFRSPKSFGAVNIPGIQTFAPGVRDSTIAIAAALLLFIIPVSWDEGKFTLDWATAKKIPWGVLVLFGGGLSLALAMSESGLATWVGNGVALLGDVPLWVLAAVVATLFVFLTELTSNLATTTMAMPIMVGVAAALNVEPVVLMSIAALAASMAFMLPVATPPNAIVFGSGYLTIPQMARAGIAMNIIAIAIVALVGSVLVPIFIT